MDVSFPLGRFDSLLRRSLSLPRASHSQSQGEGCDLSKSGFSSLLETKEE